MELTRREAVSNGIPRSLVLFVDDQAVARKYFSMMFSQEYEVLTASNAEEAWRKIQRIGERIAVIITDQRMEPHTGVELLQAVRRSHPNIVRLLTTSYGDLDAAIEAVRSGEIYAYVYKPWNIEEFSLDIRRAVELHHLQKERDRLARDRGLQTSFRGYAERIRMYGIIAAACAGLLDRPVAAVLAYISDSLRHFRLVAQDNDAGPASDGDDLRQLMTGASEIGRWLAANRRAGDMIVSDATIAVMDLVEDLSIPFECLPTSPKALVDRRLLTAGIRELLFFIQRLAARNQRSSDFRLQAAGAAEGGFCLRVLARHESVAASRPNAECNLRQIEIHGICAYFAILHLGGSLTIEGWSEEETTVRIQLPLQPPATTRRSDAIAEFHEFLARPLPSSR